MCGPAICRGHEDEEDEIGIKPSCARRCERRRDASLGFTARFLWQQEDYLCFDPVHRII